jgi:hypothetical protein
MPTLSGAALKQRLEARAFTDLFVEELGWDRLRGSAAQQLAVDGDTVRLEGLAQKREVPVYLLRAGTLPDRNRRRRIERELSRRQLEHLLIFLDEASGAQVWQWVKREAGKPDRVREHPWRPGMGPEQRRSVDRVISPFPYSNSADCSAGARSAAGYGRYRPCAHL